MPPGFDAAMRRGDTDGALRVLKDAVEKEGRTLSAKTRAKIEEAIGHGEQSIAHLRAILSADDAATAANAAARDEERAADVLNTWAAADVRRF